MEKLNGRIEIVLPQLGTAVPPVHEYVTRMSSHLKQLQILAKKHHTEQEIAVPAFGFLLSEKYRVIIFGEMQNIHLVYNGRYSRTCLVRYIENNIEKSGYLQLNSIAIKLFLDWYESLEASKNRITAMPSTMTYVSPKKTRGNDLSEPF